MSAPPAYRQDWVWPVTSASLPHYLDFALSAWAPQSLGYHNIYPSFAPLWIASYIAIAFFGITLGLKVLLTLLCFAAAFGASYLARQITSQPWLDSSIAGIAYVGLPAYADKLIAGHLGILVVWAALPFALAYVLGDTPKADWKRWACIVATLCCSVQLQYIFLAPLALFFAFLGAPSKRRAITLVLATVAIAAANAPSLVQLPANYQITPWLAREHTILQWEFAHSLRQFDALRGIGYIGGYDRLSLAPAFLATLHFNALIALPYLGALAIVLRPRLVWIGPILMYAFGVVVLENLWGPFAQNFTWMYENVTAASALRETFHFVPFVVLPLSVALAALPAAGERLRSNIVTPTLFVIASAVAILVSAASLTGVAGLWLHSYTADAQLNRIVTAVTALPNGARAVITPTRQPVFSAAAGSYGLDPLTAYPVGDHWIARDYDPLGLTSLAADLLQRNKIASAKQLFRKVSVGLIVLRRDPQPGDAHVAEPSSTLRLRGELSWPAPSSDRFITVKGRPLVFGSAIPLLVDGDFTQLLKTSNDDRVLAFMRQTPAFVHTAARYEVRGNTAEDVLIALGCRPLQIPTPSYVNAWPSVAWVDARRFAFQNPTLDTPVAPAVVTQSAGARNPLPASDKFLTATFANVEPATFHWTRAIPVADRTNAVAVGGGISMAGPACTSSLVSSHAVPNSTVVTAWNRLSNVHLSGSLSVMKGAGTVAFTDAYDPGWQLWIDGQLVDPRRHFAADGTTNGWVIAEPRGTHRFDIIYQPASLFYRLQLIALLAWIAAIAMLSCSLAVSRR